MKTETQLLGTEAELNKYCYKTYGKSFADMWTKHREIKQ